jgi:isopentenyl diphosphate isomerase/L-lactate dehydrogenase-like FMN-dependent dehydrogenase
MTKKVTYNDMDGPVDFSKRMSIPEDSPDYLKLVGRKPTGLIETEEGYNHLSNRDIFKLFAIKTRVIDAVPADTTFDLFGNRFRTPILSSALSSLGTKAMIAIAEGVKEAGSIMGVGISSEMQLEKILSVEVATIKYVKPFQNREMMAKKLRHAQESGAIAVGCDVIYGFGAKWGEKVLLSEGMSPVNQKELEHLVNSVSVPFIVKGVLSVEDAVKARAAGAKGIVVSNHAGLVLDYCVHPLEVISDIREAVGKEMVIFVDSGFRRGTDTFKALALGADAVLFGSIFVSAYKVGKRDGVRDLITVLTEELRRVMSLTGCSSLKEIDEKAIHRRNCYFS